MIAAGRSPWTRVSLGALTFVLVTACDGAAPELGGLVSDGGGGSTAVSAQFEPEVAAPGSGSVAMLEDESSGAEVTLAVALTDVDNFFGADFTIQFDSELVEFVGVTAGAALGSAGSGPTLLVNSSVPGSIVIAASRSSAAGTQDVAGTVALVYVTLRALAAGTSGVAFDPAASPSLLGGPSLPTTLVGIGPWSGGSIQAL